VKENIILSFKNNPGEKILNSLLPAGIFKKQYTILSEKAEEILEKIHLTEVRFNLAGQISYGQQKLLTIGCCIANDAQLLLLDEPVAGIDSNNYQCIYNLILQLKEEGRTVLQIEHNHKFIKDLSDNIWFLNLGKAHYFENYNMFINDSLVKKAYLN
jgi:ABC-type branched-subunit amino acid transport system ATPase component